METIHLFIFIKKNKISNNKFNQGIKKSVQPILQILIKNEEETCKWKGILCS